MPMETSDKFGTKLDLQWPISDQETKRVGRRGFGLENKQYWDHQEKVLFRFREQRDAYSKLGSLKIQSLLGGEIHPLCKKQMTKKKTEGREKRYGGEGG